MTTRTARRTETGPRTWPVISARGARMPARRLPHHWAVPGWPWRAPRSPVRRYWMRARITPAMSRNVPYRASARTATVLTSPPVVRSGDGCVVAFVVRVAPGQGDHGKSSADDEDVGEVEGGPPAGVQVVGDHSVAGAVGQVGGGPAEDDVGAVRQANTATATVIRPVRAITTQEGSASPMENATPGLKARPRWTGSPGRAVLAHALAPRSAPAAVRARAAAGRRLCRGWVSGSHRITTSRARQRPCPCRLRSCRRRPVPLPRLPCPP